MKALEAIEEQEEDAKDIGLYVDVKKFVVRRNLRQSKNCEQVKQKPVVFSANNASEV